MVVLGALSPWKLQRRNKEAADVHFKRRVIGAGSEYAKDTSVTVSADAESCKVYMTMND